MIDNDNINEQITVLGKTFTTEEERRESFRNELRQKLPELKKMEGFPIGEDEDILNLSDPPYYTACPNPWLNDFIDQWEDKKKMLEKEGKRNPRFEVDGPGVIDVQTQKNHPVYNAHNYHTKVPHQAIMRYLMYYTQPGDIILDSFAGTGMTGVAANYCESPDREEQLAIINDFRSAKNKIQEWGQRNVIQGDLSPIASFIAHNHTNKSLLRKFPEVAEKIFEEVKEKYNHLYTTNDSEGTGEIVYTIWSENLICPNCNAVFNYWEEAVPEMGKVLKEFHCPSCNTILKKSNGGNKSTKKADKFFNTAIDENTGEIIQKYSLKPVLINYLINGKRKWKRPDKEDLKIIEECENSEILKETPAFRMPNGDEARRNDKFGFMHTNDFYTKRNLIIINEFYVKINEYNGGLKNYLLKWFTSSLNRLTLFNRFAPNHSRHVGPMANTLYISGTPTEISPFNFFQQKIKDNTLDLGQIRFSLHIV